MQNFQRESSNWNAWAYYIEFKESVKCASVNRKLEAEVISMCVVSIWVGHEEFNKDVQNICYAGQLQPRLIH